MGKGHDLANADRRRHDATVSAGLAPAVVRLLEAGPEGLDVICIGDGKHKGGDTERFKDF
jgi:hypothetical protein